MPLYEIQHVCHLTPYQQDELAEAITRIHSTKFTTPRMFVNVRYTDHTNDSASPVTYVGGKRLRANHIIANVRAGPSRTQRDWNDLCREIVEAWDRIVPMPQAKGSKQQDYTLRTCVLLGGMLGGYEAGFMLPQAGQDVQWMRDHLDEFEKRASSGEEEFMELVGEIRERALLGRQNGGGHVGNGSSEYGHDQIQSASGRSAKEQLEEALGWGDSA